MKRYLMALALLGCMAGMAQADYLIIRVNLGIPPLPPKEMPKMNGPGGFIMGPYGMPMMRPPQPPPVVKPKGSPLVKKGAPDNSPPLTLVVFVEYNKAQRAGKDFQKDITYTLIRHKWGKTFLAFDQHIVHITPLFKKEGVAAQYKTRNEGAGRPGNRIPKKLLELAEWALVHNAHDEKGGPEFLNVMSELVKLNAKKAIAEPEVQAALKAYRSVNAELQKPILKDDAKIWKEKLGRVATSDHYALVYDPESSPTSEVNSRLSRLEQNYQQFYYWFALRGKVLPAPSKRLLAVLLGSPAEFRRQYVAFDTVPIVADGFHARRENIVFFSGKRLDAVSDAFDKNIADLRQNGWDFKQLLQGIGRQGKTGPEIAYAQTMALVDKCLQEESEIATVSHEGTRQLLTAVGILPRGVQLPSWLEFGLPSVFETPKYDPFLRTGAFYPMFAGPSWTYLVNFKLMDMEKRLEPSEDALRHVVTDAYFHQAARFRQPALLLNARTMAWSLAYYLAQRDLEGLRRYCRELDQLPRDLDFDEGTYLACFARAFHLEDPKQPDGIDRAKLKSLAADWYKFIGQTTPLPMKETLDEAQKALKEYREKSGAKGAG